jgi:hypothetical protein
MAPYGLNLTQFEDEQLVVLATECGYSPARDELLGRFRDSSSRLVRRLAARAGFQEADQQDVEQEAVFWLLEAIRSYRTTEQGCRVASAVVASPRESPGRQAERRESRARLQQELDRLEPSAQTLWGLLSQGMPLRNVANELHMSYPAAKRRRRKLFAELQGSLGKDFHP